MVIQLLSVAPVLAVNIHADYFCRLLTALIDLYCSIAAYHFSIILLR